MNNKKEVKHVVDVNAEQIVKNSDNEAFGVGNGFKVKGHKKTDKDSLVLFVPKGAKKRFDKLSRSERKKKKIPEKISDGKIELYTDIVEIDMPKPMPVLNSYLRPFYTGVEISADKVPTAGTAGLIVRLPIWGDCLCTNWHVVSNPYIVYAGIDEPMNRSITQPYISGISIGKVVAYNKPKLLKEGDPWSLNTADVADFAIIQLVPNGNLDQQNKSSMDNLIDMMFEKLSDNIYDAWDQILPDGATFVGFPHNHFLFENKIAYSENNEIKFFKYCKGLGIGSVGDYCYKTGRTTNLTEGEIIYTNVLCQINYHQGIGVFKNLYFVGPDFSKYDKMIGPGDSGSALFDENNYCIGNCFAGSGPYLIANTIQDCFKSIIPENLVTLLRLNRED